MAALPAIMRMGLNIAVVLSWASGMVGRAVDGSGGGAADHWAQLEQAQDRRDAGSLAARAGSSGGGGEPAGLGQASWSLIRARASSWPR